MAEKIIEGYFGWACMGSRGWVDFFTASAARGREIHQRQANLKEGIIVTSVLANSC